MNALATRPAPTRRTRRFAAVLLGAAVLAVGLSGTAGAKEIGSGGAPAGGGTPAVCNPVANLTVKADATTGELGVGSIQASYSVKPCTNGQALTVETTVSEFYAPDVVIYDNPGAVLNGKFQVNGVRIRTLYTVAVTAYDAATGAQAGRLQTVTAAVPKGV